MKRQLTNRTNVSIFEPLECRQMMSAGDLDPSFGTAGKVLASETVGFSVADMAVQPDGKMVVVGTRNNDFAVARLNANGTLDRAFGGINRADGIVQADFGGDRGDRANTVAIQADGKIVVGGIMDDVTDSVFVDVGGFAIARFNKDGTLDRSFDGDGKLLVDMPGVEPSFVNALAIQPDGKILAAGTAGTRGRFDIRNGLQNDFAIARIMPSGALDKSFDGDGIQTIGFGGDDDEGALAVSLSPGGQIVVGGMGGPTASRFAVARLNSDGSMDGTFGDGISGKGKFNNLILAGANFRDLTATDGHVTIVGGNHGNFLTVRLTADGHLDRSFNGSGHIETDFGANDDAKHVVVNREGILVAGGTSGKFAMTRLRLNGAQDSTFGISGKVITPAGPNDAILTTVHTPDGKFIAYGRNGSAVRYFATNNPIVNVFSLRPDGAEGGDNASLIFTRNIRASFPTRIFFDLGGTAALSSDYTGPSTMRIFETAPSAPGTLAPVTIKRIGFVDIPANQTTAIVPITVVDDKAFDPGETILATIRTDSSYALGDRTTQQVDIADNDLSRVNFQVTATPFAFAYEPDLGLPFGARPNGQQFGWDVDNKANARDRGFDAAPGMSIIYTTFNHMQKSNGASKWEFAVPNGMYQVRLAAGDPEQVDSVYRMNLEGQLALSGTPSGSVRWFERMVNVQVNDGRLTLTNASGAVNNKIAFIELRSAPQGAVAGPVTDNLPIRLPAPKFPAARIPAGGALVAQIGI